MTSYVDDDGPPVVQCDAPRCGAQVEGINAPRWWSFEQNDAEHPSTSYGSGDFCSLDCLLLGVAHRIKDGGAQDA